jgi:hypothetical protein
MNDLIVCARNCAFQPSVTPKLDARLRRSNLRKNNYFQEVKQDGDDRSVSFGCEGPLRLRVENPTEGIRC